MMNKIIVLCSVTLCLSGAESDQTRLDLSEGSNCSWNGLVGKCTNILSCRSAEDGLRLKIYAPICSFQGSTPIICCTDCLPDQCTTTAPVTDIPVGSRFNVTRSKARDNCIKFVEELNYPYRYLRSIQYEERRHPKKNYYDYVEPSSSEDADIIHTFGDQRSPVKRHTTQDHPSTEFNGRRGQPSVSAGVPALLNQYPHMALLGYGDDMKTAQWLCGGSIISEKFILTAAHCISSPAVGLVKYIALGILRRTDPPELWQTYNVKRIIPHPQYQPPSKYNDIALLETEKTIHFSISVLPACLHLKPESDEIAEATGWGALGHHRALADTLQTVTLRRNDEDQCFQLYPKHRHLREGYNHKTQMCYGDAEIPKDTCEGDSGGPLQIKNKFLRCSYTVIGVTSYGRQCGISAGSGMYTRVYHYVPWIESIVWP